MTYTYYDDEPTDVAAGDSGAMDDEIPEDSSAVGESDSGEERKQPSPPQQTPGNQRNFGSKKSQQKNERPQASTTKSRNAGTNEAKQAASKSSQGVQQAEQKTAQNTGNQLAHQGVKQGANAGKHAAQQGARTAIKSGATAAKAGATSTGVGALGTAGEQVAEEGIKKGFKTANRIQRTARHIENVGAELNKFSTDVQDWFRKWGRRLGYIAICIFALIFFSVSFSAVNMLLDQQAANANPTTPESPLAAISILKSVSAQTAAANQTLTYTLDISSTNSASTTIKLNDTIPANTTFQSATGNPACDNGKCSATSKTITWDATVPAAPGKVTVSFMVKINPTAKNIFITNTATLNDAPLKSNCVVTQVGIPADTTLPAGCINSALIKGIILPPNLGPCIKVPAELEPSTKDAGGVAGEYCKMPDSLDGSYRLQGTRWGSKEIIGVLYTVAQRWKNTFPEGNLVLQDISATTCPYPSSDKRCDGYHKDHAWGIAVDVTATTNKKDCVANENHDGRCPYSPGTFNAPATITLAKMFIDTGYFDLFLFKSDVSVRDELGKVTTLTKEIYQYAHSKYPDRFTSTTRAIQNRNDHLNHFHLYISRENQKTYAQTYLSHSYIFEHSKLQHCHTVSTGTGKVC